MSTVDALHCAFARRRSRAGARDCSAPSPQMDSGTHGCNNSGKRRWLVPGFHVLGDRQSSAPVGRLVVRAHQPA